VRGGILLLFQGLDSGSGSGHCRVEAAWFCLSHREFNVGFSCLSLLATVRGGTSFLFPTAKKKRSKENAYKR
jgi:hypothetical protein